MKLRRLILQGFKSFPDRTEFVFDDGITCLVGPNGCGKSNVVDAVKWVLGEQSAKSLRGLEMMDVIFNGSAGRRASGLCEVTLEFDNDDGVIQPVVSAASERKPQLVSVTRRLYRSGESEYLVNRHMVRLRDIREMFMDTGVGTNAYSLVEQGKVAQLLQSNPVERRVIFEEAAGISKYNARKREALRKLDRVDQNLLRLNDILSEVQKRLRSIKYQAGKARSYQGYCEKLKSLRSLFSLASYHRMRQERTALQGRLDAVSDQVISLAARIDQLEANHAAAVAELAELETQARQTAGQIASVAGQIITCEERIEMLAARSGELAERIEAATTRGAELADRMTAAEGAIAARRSELGTIELQIRQHTETVEAMLDDQQAGALELTRLQAELDDEKAGTIDLLRRTSQLHNEIAASGVRTESLTGQRDRLSRRAEEVAAQMAELIGDRARIDAKLTDIAQVAAEAGERLEAVKAEGLALAAQQADIETQLTDARERRGGLQSRRSTLEEMHRRGEGLAEGARRVLAARDAGKLPFVLGLLADFVAADFEHAAVVDAALGPMEQAVLIDRQEHLLAGRGGLAEALDGAGAELLCLDRLEAAPQEVELTDLPVAAVRLTDLLRFDEVLARPLSRLLARTLVVDDLPAACAAAAVLPAGWTLVTRDGEALGADGRIRLGRAASAGLISRQSELIELTDRLGALQGEITDLSSRQLAATDQRKHADDLQQQFRTAIYEANTERVNYQGQSDRLGEQLTRLETEEPVIAADIRGIAGEIEDAVRAAHAAREQVAELDKRSAERQAHIDTLNARLAALQQRQQELQSELTERRVLHARAIEQQARGNEALTQMRQALQRTARERTEALDEIEASRRRQADAAEAVTKARASIEAFYSQKTELDQQAVDLEQTRTGLNERLEEIRTARTECRRQHEQAVEGANGLRVEAGEADVRIEDLITRVSEEIGMELVASYADYEHDDARDWDAVKGEIQELRAKLQRLGNVNLDAIGEQEELEQREGFLGSQLTDVRDSHRQLTELIGRINRESRRMFTETFEAVRGNFQVIFRKLFGGGKADILLTDPADVLESGIEIVARPPGKELRSITLLSGGEKTMATVALLFSIFRAKPSPFCVLDEVDAALDEANNERFNLLLGEFLSQSQFILITHAKRTMSVADVLYGVTMQEAGVSRRVSVRFAEAAEFAEPPPPAAEPAEPPATEAEAAAT